MDFLDKIVFNDPVSIIIFFLMVVSLLAILFHLQNWVDNRTPKQKEAKKPKPVEESKPAEKKPDVKPASVDLKKVEDTLSKIESKIEKINIDIEKKNSATNDDICKETSPKQMEMGDEEIRVEKNTPNPSEVVVSETVKNILPCDNSNYLYERFVTTPSSDDDIPKETISKSFITEDELQKIRDRKIEIKVGSTTTSSEADKKSALYDRIKQMTEYNNATKDKMLKEFEDLPKEIKLMLINNIMQSL